MTNKEFISALASETKMEPAATHKMMNDFIEEMVSCFDESKDIVVYGFGNFELKQRKERVMVNPSTGKTMLVPPKRTLNFKTSNTLKNKLRS